MDKDAGYRKLQDFLTGVSLETLLQIVNGNRSSYWSCGSEQGRLIFVLPNAGTSRRR